MNLKTSRICPGFTTNVTNTRCLLANFPLPYSFNNCFFFLGNLNCISCRYLWCTFFC
uniref:Uncharacterized protein n=1 Tax=Ciona intestinalis TaxID=7719 RepID=H2XTX9_CIOIN